MLLDIEDSQLVLVDFQPKLIPALHEGELVWSNARRLAQLADLLDVPVTVTEHCPEELGECDEELAQFAKQVLQKDSFSAVPAGLLDALAPPKVSNDPARGNARSLPKHLRQPQAQEPERRTIVLAGCEAHAGVLQTALDLLDAEWDVWVVTDACASRTERNRDAAYDRLAGAGAELVTLEMVAFEWVREASHPAWVDVMAIIKSN